jgi:hypothetical protein
VEGTTVKKDKILMKIASLAGSGSMKGPCLSEEEIGGLIDGTVKGEEREKLISHIISCSKCAHEYEESYELIASIKDEKIKELPSGVIKKVKNYLSAAKEKDTLAVMLSWTNKLMEVLNTTGEICRDLAGAKPELVAVFRGKHKKKRSKSVKIKQKLSGVNVEVDINPGPKGRINISVKTDKDNMRATLFHKDTELESSLLKDRSVVFEKLERESYKIKIESKKGKVGVISFLF